jgi:HAD superfamily hydrolase (TIGR01549 family)
MMTAGIKTVLFDLDGTLLDRNRMIRSYAAALARDLHRASGAVLDVEDVARRIDSVDQRGNAPRRMVCRALHAQMSTCTDTPAVAWFENHWQVHFADQAVVAQGAIELIDMFRARGLKIGLISNGSGHNQRRKLKAAGLADRFDVTLISGEIAICKPDPAIFLLALRMLDASHTQAVFLGDHPAYDVQGARSVGMRAVWIAGDQTWPESLTAPEMSVREIGDLVAKVDLVLGLPAGEDGC